ncbi:ECF subfamily RNA polymerase sigma-24 factor [Oscillochloris trichoides DG-6]|uniref:ECF subfamily RNA polymerase sigma-24 factor n=1 Tax=Oscillochloris trichoides DG-6 TaxID=765420 RepID=E1IC80_9CHLR|nr:ECF subfamily RNA polymerase sigma-24 factor [Oscillochloris trichoides DG-6]
MALSAELGWGLSPKEAESYAHALQSLLPHDASYAEFRKVCAYYHTNHALVEVLRNHGHPSNTHEWQVWEVNIAQILHKNGLAWSRDGAVELKDLIQIAQAALLASLPSFRYKSSFYTWAYKVVVLCIRRHIRDTKATKRGHQADSLDENPELDLPDPRQIDPSEQLMGSMLHHTIHAILLQHGDERLAKIFDLYAVHDRPTAEIARTFDLHPSRVRALLTDARKVLRNHPEMQAWR